MPPQKGWHLLGGGRLYGAPFSVHLPGGNLKTLAEEAKKRIDHRTERERIMSHPTHSPKKWAAHTRRFFKESGFPTRRSAGAPEPSVRADRPVPGPPDIQAQGGQEEASNFLFF